MYLFGCFAAETPLIILSTLSLNISHYVPKRCFAVAVASNDWSFMITFSRSLMEENVILEAEVEVLRDISMPVKVWTTFCSLEPGRAARG